MAKRDYVVVHEGAKQTPLAEWQTALWGELATLEYGKSLRDYDSPAGVYKVYGTNGQIGWHSEPVSRSVLMQVSLLGARGPIGASTTRPIPSS